MDRKTNAVAAILLRCSLSGTEGDTKVLQTGKDHAEKESGRLAFKRFGMVADAHARWRSGKPYDYLLGPKYEKPTADLPQAICPSSPWNAASTRFAQSEVANKSSVLRLQWRDDLHRHVRLAVLSGPGDGDHKTDMADV